MSNLTRHCAQCDWELNHKGKQGRLILKIQSAMLAGEAPDGKITVHNSREIETVCEHCAENRMKGEYRYRISGKGPVSVGIGIGIDGHFFMSEEAWGVTSDYLIFTDVFKEHFGIFREAIGAKPGHPIHILWRLRELFAGQDAYWRIHDFLKKQKIPHQSGVFRTGFDD